MSCRSLLLLFSNDGHSLTSVSGDAVTVWDVSAGTELRSQKTKYGKSGMEKLNSLSSFGCVFGCGNKQRKQEEQRLKNFKMSASKIAVSSNGQVAAVGQPDKGVEVYTRKVEANAELPFKASPEAENSSSRSARMPPRRVRQNDRDSQRPGGRDHARALQRQYRIQ
jgi:hypothetical protein